jgi:hypothetical protein
VRGAFQLPVQIVVKTGRGSHNSKRINGMSTCQQGDYSTEAVDLGGVLPYDGELAPALPRTTDNAPRTTFA